MSDCVFSDNEDKKVVKKTSKKVLRMHDFYGKIVHFNCEKMTYDAKGKKVVMLPVGWQKLKSTPMYNGESKPKVHGVLTGKVNDITVFDFDAKEVYEEVIKKYPVLKECLTVSTKKGYHVYVKYDEKFKQTSNDRTKIDIRNDGGFVYGMGTMSETGDKYRLYIDGVMDMEAPLEFYEEYFGKVEKVNDEKKIKKNNNKEIKINIGNELELIDIIDEKYINNYGDWTKVVWSGKNVGISKEKLIEISMKSDKYDEEVFERVYKYTYPLLTMGTLKYYARSSDSKKYMSIMNNSNETDIYTDGYLADMLLNICVDLFVFKENELYTYYDNKWRLDNNKSFMRKIVKMMLKDYACDIISKISKRLMKATQDDKKEEIEILTGKQEKAGKFAKSIHKASLINSVCDALVSGIECYYVDINIEFDDKPNIFCFTDKAFDVLTGKEHTVSKDDYITQNTGYEYVEPTKEEYKTVKKLFKQIFPDKEVRKCYQSILLQGMTGYRQELFFLATGQGRNGKGLLNELFSELLGNDYFYKMAVDILTSPKDLSSGANPQVANMNKKRFILSSEPDDESGEKLKMARIKDMTGGKDFNARQLYKSKCIVKMCHVLLLECNELLKLSGKMNDSVLERIVVVMFMCTFTNNLSEVDEANHIYPVNTYYKTSEFQKNHKIALFKYLLNEAPKEIYIPDVVKECSKEYVCDSDDFLVWFNEHYEKGNDDNIIKLKDLYDDFKNSENYNNLTKEVKRKYNKKKMIDNISTNIVLKKYYRNDMKKINRNTYTERIHNYKKKIIEDE